MKDPHDIIISPLLTEKAYDGLAGKRYVFVVAKDANKTEIRQAIEQVFGVQVAKVNTMNRTGKVKRMGQYSGRRPGTKKAYVVLKPTSKAIEFFEGMA